MKPTCRKSCAVNLLMLSDLTFDLWYGWLLVNSLHVIAFGEDRSIAN